jgi:hypothetical protein
MTTATSNTIVGIFRDRAQAQESVRALKQAGFRDEQIGILSPGHDGNEPAIDDATNSKIGEGSIIGAATGAGAGALWALGIAAGVLPVIGPAVAGGILMSVLASAGGAAMAGTLVGGLVGLGIPQDEASAYEGEVHSGSTLVTVRADNREMEAWQILQRYNANFRETPIGSTRW